MTPDIPVLITAGVLLLGLAVWREFRTPADGAVGAGPLQAIGTAVLAFTVVAAALLTVDRFVELAL